MGDEQDDENLCGCTWVGVIEQDGRRVHVHHAWPDDGAPHAPTSECGCGPQRLELSPVLVVYEHVGQDLDFDPCAED